MSGDWKRVQLVRWEQYVPAEDEEEGEDSFWGSCAAVLGLASEESMLGFESAMCDICVEILGLLLLRFCEMGSRS